MKTLKEISRKLKKDIEEFFLSDNNQYDVDVFVRGMKIKLSHLLPSNINLSPLSIDDPGRYKVHSNQISEFLDLAGFLAEKEEAFANKKAK